MDLVKLIEYLVSAVIAVLSNLWVGSLTRTKIYFLPSSACGDKLLSTPKILTFLSQLSQSKFGTKRN